MEGSSGGFPVPLLMIAIAIVTIAAWWRVFEKAGKPAWVCLVPIYNVIVLLQIAGRPVWWLILFLIPFVNGIASLVVPIDVARAFRTGVAFGLGLFFPGFVFHPILGFGAARQAGATSRQSPGSDRRLASSGDAGHRSRRARVGFSSDRTPRGKPGLSAGGLESCRPRRATNPGSFLGRWSRLP